MTSVLAFAGLILQSAVLNGAAPVDVGKPIETANNMGLIRKLELSPTAVDRLGIIPNSSDWVYDFQNPPENAITQGKGGCTVRSDRRVFPASVGTGVAMTVRFLGPCGFNTLHTHPRSSEINIVVEGRIETEFIAENNAPNTQNSLNKFQKTVVPQGATHIEFNAECEPAIFVAGFGNEDPGVQQSVQTFFSLNGEIIQTALGIETISGEDIETFKGQLPANVALGVESCLIKCGIPKNGSREPNNWSGGY